MDRRLSTERRDDTVHHTLIVVDHTFIEYRHDDTIGTVDHTLIR